MVLQAFELLECLTALEHVLRPMELVPHWPKTRRLQRARQLMADLGVLAQANKLPADLSGGEQQRVALARALANDPPLIVADEPTGNLDSVNGERVLALLAELTARGKTVIVVTHDPRHRAHFGRSVELCDGSLV